MRTSTTNERSQSKAPLAPGQANYSERVEKGAYERAGEQYHSVARVSESTAAPGAHSCGSGLKTVGSFRSHFVENGVGTKVQGVAFRSSVSYNAKNEPCVSIHPYKLDGKVAHLHDSKITDALVAIAKEYQKQGVAVPTTDAHGNVNGHKQVAPRLIVFQEEVLDFHGRGPAEWIPPGAKMHLENLSFSPKK